MLSLKIAATGLAVAALAWLAIQACDPGPPLFIQAMLGPLVFGGVAISIIAGLFTVWS